MKILRNSRVTWIVAIATSSFVHATLLSLAMLAPGQAVDSLSTIEAILVEFTDLGAISTYPKLTKDAPVNVGEITVEQKASFEIETLDSDIPLQFLPSSESSIAVLQSQRSQYARQNISDIAAEIARIGMSDDRTSRPTRIRRMTPNSIRGFEEKYYLDAWVRKVQRVGQLNYPQEASEKSQYGTLRWLAAISRDGRLLDVRITESSGYRALDDAAVRIVQLAAPYAPFPAKMRKIPIHSK